MFITKCSIINIGHRILWVLSKCLHKEEGKEEERRRKKGKEIGMGCKIHPVE